MINSDPEANDFFLANGGFSDKSFELLSYTTDNKQSGDSAPYLTSPEILHDSETHGYSSLAAKGNCFSNAPEPATDYVARDDLEKELFELLIDDRHPVITLQGAGGVGKTSSTLQVIERLYTEDRYQMIVWFSARDIDLLSSGPQVVRPGVLSLADVANLYADFVLSQRDLDDKSFDKRQYFRDQLSESDGGHTPFIFDNFETVQNPEEMFSWIESSVRLPNKVLITTRLRTFRGDYPVEVGGMTEQEARTLIHRTASHLGIPSLLTSSNITDMISQSEGHPYVIKILLGEVAHTKKFNSPRQVIAGSDEILTALFERTFKALSPCGQRAFMTLSAWNSAVPRVALEAVLIKSTEERSEVEKGIESLLHYSLAEARVAPEDDQEFISLPLAANTFGKKQLQINILKSVIQSDVEILRMFTPTSIADANLNFSKPLEAFIKNLSERIDKGELFDDYAPILNMVCTAYNPGRLLLARWHLERGTQADVDAAISNIQAFLQLDQNGPASADAWRMLGHAYYKQQNILGEIQAYIERSEFDSVPFYDVSNTASSLNSKYQELDIEYDAKRRLATRLLEVMERRITEANPDDLSRMAWLALRLGLDNKAISFTKMGLEMDLDNLHCVRIAGRLGVMP